MVRRQTLMVLAVALLLSVAGCRGTTQTDDSENETTAGSYEKAGNELDGATLENNTADAVKQAGSYMFQKGVVREPMDQSRTVEQTETVRVDIDAKRGTRIEEVSRTHRGEMTEWTKVDYTVGNTSYRKGTKNGETYYDSSDSEGAYIGEVEVTSFDYDYAAAIDGFAWEKQDTTEFRGTTVTRYVVTGVADKSELVGEETTIEDANGTLLVDADGVVHRLSASATLNEDGTTTTSSVTYTLSKVGSTTVEEPDWLSEAKSS